MNIEQARKEYNKIRARACYDGASHTEFDEAFVALRKSHESKTGHRLSPCELVKLAEKVAVRCRRCGGTGRFVTMVVNGQPRGPGGECYRCAGKGAQTSEDGARCRSYDKHAFERAAAAMFAGP
jgi:hypothetical protein